MAVWPYIGNGPPGDLMAELQRTYARLQEAELKLDAAQRTLREINDLVVESGTSAEEWRIHELTEAALDGRKRLRYDVEAVLVNAARRLHVFEGDAVHTPDCVVLYVDRDELLEFMLAREGLDALERGYADGDA